MNLKSYSVADNHLGYNNKIDWAIISLRTAVSLFVFFFRSRPLWTPDCKVVSKYLYNPKTNFIAGHLHCIGRGIDFYSSKYDNFVVLGDLNTEISNSFMEQFCASYNLKSLIKEPTCFKSVDNPSCIDLILTNHPKCFQNSGVYETGISDFHKLTFTVLKTYFQKAKPRIMKYRDYK